MDVLREEFRLKNFRLTITNPESFHLSKFPSVTPFYLFLIRSIIALFYTSMCITSITQFGSWIAIFFLTDLTYLLVTIHFITLWIISLIGWRWPRAIFLKTENNVEIEGNDVDAASGTQVSKPYYRFLQFSWLLSNIAVVVALLISVMYWTVVFRSLGSGIRAYLNIEQHSIFLIPIFINFVLGLPPVRLLHVVYTIIFGFMYVATIAILWETEGFAPYTVLDFSKVGTALTTTFLAAFIGVPLLHLIVFGIYKLCLRQRKRSAQRLQQTTAPDTAATSF